MTDNQRNSYGYDFQHMQPIDTTKEGENMNFKDLTECPFCGYDKYYGKYFTYGTVHMYSKYDGKFQSSANSEAYDNLITRKDSGRMYCGNCNRYIGNIYTDKISSAAEKALKQSKE